MNPCEKLPAGLREICEGTSGHSTNKRHEYLMQWLNNGSIERLPDNYSYIPDKSRGLGDTIAKATKAIGILPCGGCGERQEFLNKVIPYQ